MLLDQLNCLKRHRKIIYSKYSQFSSEILGHSLRGEYFLYFSEEVSSEENIKNILQGGYDPNISLQKTVNIWYIIKLLKLKNIFDKNIREYSPC